MNELKQATLLKQYQCDWAERIQQLKQYPEWKEVAPFVPEAYHRRLPDILTHQSWNNAVWNAMGMDPHTRDEKKLEEFYQHPIWIIVGIFSECNPHSIINRFKHSACVSFLPQESLNIFESGGGFGALARIILQRFDSQIESYDIVEPYVNDFLKELAKPYNKLNYLAKDPENKTYDLVISTEVIEHIPDPLSYLKFLDQKISQEGFLYITADFNPVIFCHLEYNFYWKHCWQKVLELMGYELIYSLSEKHGFFQKLHNAFPAEDIERVLRRAKKLKPVFDLGTKLESKKEGLLTTQKLFL